MRLYPDPGKEIAMLQVTEAAASLLKSEVLSKGGPQPEAAPASAVRIQLAAASDGRQAISLRPVSGPEAGDVPTEAPDLDVFVASELADPLDSAILDAHDTPQGPEMFLREQSAGT
jgi:hypothetical protein